MNNDHEREMFRSLMKSFSYAMHKNTLEEMQNIVSRKLAAERSEESKMSREYLEHHPSIETDVTDEDMLLLQIDMALDSGDMEMFMRLTDELKGMGSARKNKSVCYLMTLILIGYLLSEKRMYSKQCGKRI